MARNVSASVTHASECHSRPMTTDPGRWTPATGSPRRLRRGAPLAGTTGQCVVRRSASARIELDHQVRLHLHGVGHLGELRDAHELRRHLGVVDLDVVRYVALAEPGRFEHQRELLRLVLELDQVADLDPIARDGDAPAVDLDVAVVDELACREHRGDELGAIDHGIEPALEQPDHVRAGIALHADGLGVDAAELPLGDIAVIAAQLLLGAQLHAVVGELALAALAVLAGPVFPAVDGALGAAPHVLAHTAVDLVLRLVALGHRVLMLVSGRGSRPPLSRGRRDRQVLPEAPDETAGRETARGPESPRRARFLRGKPGRVKPGSASVEHRSPCFALAISTIWAHIGGMGYGLHQLAGGFLIVLLVSAMAWYFWVRPDELEKVVQDNSG